MEQLQPVLRKYIDKLIGRYPALSSSAGSIAAAYRCMEGAFEGGHKLLVCGNGGSAADSEHIVGELMKGFCLSRKISMDFAEQLVKVDSQKGRELASKLQGALPAIALDCHNALNTAYLNDVDGLMCYAQQVMGYGSPGDVMLGISTSGNSQNVLYAAVTARARGLNIIGLTGETGGALKGLSDVCIRVPETETYKIQEMHLPVYHCLCLMLEEHFFNNE